jgi:hypothetical protein
MIAYLRWAMLTLSACQTASVQVGDVGFTRATVSVGEGPTAAAAGDLNGDGHQDIVVANQLSHDLTILLGDGTGQLRSGGRVPGGEDPGDVALADLNGDGNLDIVVPNHDTDYLTILHGDGTGGFRAAPNSPLSIAVAPHPHAVQTVDINADGHTDLLVDDRQGEGLLILKGLGDGHFESPGQRVPMGGDPYRGIAVADIDRDGRLDLATPNPDHVGMTEPVNSPRQATLHSTPPGGPRRSFWVTSTGMGCGTPPSPTTRPPTCCSSWADPASAPDRCPEASTRGAP